MLRPTRILTNNHIRKQACCTSQLFFGSNSTLQSSRVVALANALNHQHAMCKSIDSLHGGVLSKNDYRCFHSTIVNKFAANEDLNNKDTSSSGTTTFLIRVPLLEDIGLKSGTEVTIVDIHRGVGEFIEEEDPIASVRLDDGQVVEIKSPESAFLKRSLCQKGQKIRFGSPMFEMAYSTDQADVPHTGLGASESELRHVGMRGTVKNQFGEDETAPSPPSPFTPIAVILAIVALGVAFMVFVKPSAKKTSEEDKKTEEPVKKKLKA